MIKLAFASRVSGPLALVLAACSSSSPSPTNKGDAGRPAADGAPVVPASPHALIGEACKSSDDCDTGLKCATEDPGGQCFKECKPSTDTDCGDTKLYACSFEGHCYAKCATVADCARADEGYVCKNDTPPRAGIKFCDVK